jgi:hypothetical protein
MIRRILLRLAVLYIATMLVIIAWLSADRPNPAVLLLLLLPVGLVWAFLPPARRLPSADEILARWRGKV